MSVRNKMRMGQDKSGFVCTIGNQQHHMHMLLCEKSNHALKSYPYRYIIQVPDKVVARRTQRTLIETKMSRTLPEDWSQEVKAWVQHTAKHILWNPIQINPLLTMPNKVLASLPAKPTVWVMWLTQASSLLQLLFPLFPGLVLPGNYCILPEQLNWIGCVIVFDHKLQERKDISQRDWTLWYRLQV